MGISLYRNGGATLVPLGESGTPIHSPVVTFSYNHPHSLRFTVCTDQHSIPFQFNEGVKFFDTRFHSTEPLFVGHVRRIIPQASKEVVIECLDPSARAAEELYIFDGLATDPTVVPRCVYNCTQDTDDDYAWNQIAISYATSSQSSGLPSIITPIYPTVAQILQNLFDNQESNLIPLTLSGSSATPYDNTGASSLDYQPQEKIVFDSENLLSGIQRLLQLYPQYRLFYDPSSYKWKLHLPWDASAQTITLNSLSETHPVLSLNLDRGLERRYTAVSLYGKREMEYADVSTTGGGLTPLPDPSGLTRRWQITDPTKRHITRRINPGRWIPVVIPQGNAGVLFTLVFFTEPALLFSFDNGETYRIASDARFDPGKGIAEVSYYPLWTEANPSATPQQPDDVRLVYCYYTAAIILREPTTGYEGTAYTQFAIEKERRFYHEFLNTGYLKWDTVTAAQKQTQYRKLAKNFLRASKDVIYSGGATLLGLDFRWARLNKRLNLAAVNANGGSLTTGWENAGAVVTDVEYDYGRDGVGATTLTFSSDWSQFSYQDIDTLRKVLKIKARAVYRQFWRYGMQIFAGGSTLDVQQSMGWVTYKAGETD
jgi:hypothetical protein